MRRRLRCSRWKLLRQEQGEGELCKQATRDAHARFCLPGDIHHLTGRRYCILIEHPHEGLILWETGCGKDYPEVWGPVVSDIFARIRYEPQHELRAAVEATGNKIEDIKKIIIGHLHLDHAGGLDEFLDKKDVEIWVHDKELKSAFWSVATGADVGVYLEHYLKLSL